MKTDKKYFIALKYRSNGLKFLCSAVLLVFVLSLKLQAAAAAAPEPPIDHIRNAVNAILVLMKDKDLNRPEMKEERNKRIVKVVHSYFDFREMSMRTLARHWRERTPAEQEEFERLFSKLLEKTYINRVDTYANEEVVYKGQEIRGGKAVVSTVFLRHDTEIPISYSMKLINNQWMVYDVIIEGVSLVRNYRSQFDSIINKEKYAGLVIRMEEKINKPETPGKGNDGK